ncbi:MAG TPA: hypothetical protein DCS07_03465 [Bdellovibrionales bacterium]|nr:MAG: hypothetical protein A2Z97_00870 [Bdellovibrionales bacterium GWB1_52_6]OFZ05304.1 MAG: hypothetical protein A2X97_10370 [Bdellovibrionales bacterium GWA1_52_35]OFZ39275.1 MAG: hypothetical protein A2070_13250 [Bdellovibrionales bacterium GWC1_52_8]HAR41677.1 hypothetical protein [Bdellovibrionales bacterium]HCM38681.1 hypothetical protein [Bdellovibrionales bacterium]
MRNKTFARQLAWTQGGFYLLTGIWPILHMKSFERVSGPKEDHWLVKTVGALLAVTGGALLRSARSGKVPKDLQALAAAQALALSAVDVIYSTKGRISKIYLLDAATELLLIRGWLACQARRV